MRKKLNTTDKVKGHPPAHPPVHHDVPPHILHELMIMKEKIGKLEGKIEVIQNQLIKKEVISSERRTSKATSSS